MKTNKGMAVVAVLLSVAVLASIAALAGCGQAGEPKVMVFLGKSSKSYDAMKPVVDKLQKQYKGKITWVNVDYDDPENKGEIDKYHVSMNPTVIIFNKEGKIKETFMGAVREDMLGMSVESYLPSKSTKPASQPGSVTTPGSPSPPSSMPSNVIPSTPSQ